MRTAVLLSAWLALIAAAKTAQQESTSVVFTAERLPDLPNPVGVAGPYAGISGRNLLVAGGANFPEKMAWEGGTKVWYDRIWRLSLDDLRWHEAGHLPKPLGYGVSVGWKDHVICVGGSDATGHHSDVLDLRWDASESRLSIKARTRLPRPMANLCGAVIGDQIYVAGGLETPDATETLSAFYSLRLDDPSAEWQELPTWPGPPRMLAAAAVHDKCFYLIGGTDLSAGPDGKPVRNYLKDAYRFDTSEQTWTSLSHLPRFAVAAPSPAPVVDGQIVIMSGDDGSQIQTPPTKHRGFPRDILRLDLATAQWSIGGTLEAPVVTVPAVEVREAESQVGWIVPSGEVRPGVRSAQVWNYRFP